MLAEFVPVLKNKNFVYIWVSQILSQLTISIMNFVFLIRLFEVTGSAISTALLWVAYSLPAMLIGPFASAVTDFTDKRMVLYLTNLLQALTIFLYGIFGYTNIFVIYEVVFIYSLLNQFYVPSEAATLPAVLNKNQLAHGNSLFFLTQQGSLVAGFALAGFMYAFLGFNYTLLFCAFFLFVAFISTLLLPKLKSTNTIPENFETAVFEFFKHIGDGYDFVKSKRAVLTPFLLLIGFQVALQVIMVQVPAFAQGVLSIPLSTAGVYVLVPSGIGAIIGALYVPKLIKKWRRKKMVIDRSLLIIGISFLLLLSVVPLFHYLLRIIISFIILILIGFSFVGIVIPSNTFLQEATPVELRGRVFGNFSFLVIVVSVLPVVFSGSLVEIFGIRFLLFVLSLSSIGIFIVSRRYGGRFLSG
jgi:MFS family permease